jgi:hypothetical protein
MVGIVDSLIPDSTISAGQFLFANHWLLGQSAPQKTTQLTK